MSGSLQLSGISSYSLGGRPTQPAAAAEAGQDGAPVGSASGGGNAAPTLAALSESLMLGGAGSSAAAAAAAAEEAELEGSFGDAEDEADGEEHHRGAEAPYAHASTEVDPYALEGGNASAAHASFYPSGLLGGPRGDADAEAPAGDDEQMAEQADEEERARATSEHEQNAEQYAAVHYQRGGRAGLDTGLDDDGAGGTDRRFDDAEIPAGWAAEGGLGGGSFRQLDEAEEEQLALEQRRRAEAEEEELLARGVYESGDATPAPAQRYHSRKRGYDGDDGDGGEEDDEYDQQQRSAEPSASYYYADAEAAADRYDERTGDHAEHAASRSSKRRRREDGADHEQEGSASGSGSGSDSGDDGSRSSGGSGSRTGDGDSRSGSERDDGERRSDRRTRRRRRNNDEQGSGDAAAAADAEAEHMQQPGSGSYLDSSAAAFHSAAAASTAASYLPSHPSHFANYSPATPLHAAAAARAARTSCGGGGGAGAGSGPITASYGPSTPSHTPQYGAMSNPAAASPHYSYGGAQQPQHHSSYSPSPHFGPTSPRVHSGWGSSGGGGGYYGSSVPFGASSPRQDSISSVTHRVEQLARSGRLGALLHQANRSSQEVAATFQNNAAASSHLAPDYSALSTSASASALARSSARAALVSIDQHMLRRYMLRVLDSDMLVRGVVCNKSSGPSAGGAGLAINVAEILWPEHRATELLARQRDNAAQAVAVMQIASATAAKGAAGAAGGGASAGTPDALAVEFSKSYASTQLCFPPLSSFLGAINPSACPIAASSSSSSAEVDATYATERALFANFEVLAIHGECHLAEISAPAPATSAVAGSGMASVAPSAQASLERFSLGDQVKALVISVDVHSEKVYLSMNQNRLRGSVASKHKLGVIAKEQTQQQQQQLPLANSTPAAAPGLSSALFRSTDPSTIPSSFTATPSTDPAAFSSLMAKLKPDLQSRILAYGPSANAPSAAIAAPAAPTNAAGGGSTPSYGPSSSSAVPVAPPSWSFGRPNAAPGTPSHPHSSGASLPPHLLKGRSALSGSAGGSTPLAKPSTNLLPLSLSLMHSPLLIQRARGFLPYLLEEPLFKNPQGLHKLAAAYRVNLSGSLLPRGGSARHVPDSDLYKNLRHAQNQAWAKESVVKGISLAKKGSFSNALRCYKHALDIEPLFTQAFVARGAAYVLQGQMQKAVAEFEQALSIDPQQQYALAYLQAAREKLQQQQGGTQQQSAAATEGTARTVAAPGARASAPVGTPTDGTRNKAVVDLTAASSAPAATAAAAPGAAARRNSRTGERDSGTRRDKDRRNSDARSSHSTSQSRATSSSRHSRGASHSSSSASSRTSASSQGLLPLPAAHGGSAAMQLDATDPLERQQAAVQALYGSERREKKKGSSRKRSSKKSKKRSRSSDDDRKRSKKHSHKRHSSSSRSRKKDRRPAESRNGEARTPPQAHPFDSSSFTPPLHQQQAGAGDTIDLLSGSESSDSSSSDSEREQQQRRPRSVVRRSSGSKHSRGGTAELDPGLGGSSSPAFVDLAGSEDDATASGAPPPLPPAPSHRHAPGASFSPGLSDAGPHDPYSSDREGSGGNGGDGQLLVPLASPGLLPTATSSASLNTLELLSPDGNAAAAASASNPFSDA